MKRKQKQEELVLLSHIENSPLSLALAHVDSLFERLRTNKLKAYDPSFISQLRKLSPAEIKELNHQYKKTLEDIKAACAGDSYFLEAYSCYDKSQLKIALTLLKALKTLKHDDSANGKIRAVIKRKTKTKSPEQIVQKVLFLERDKETGISSLRPEVLVGASELWIYNTKTRKLGCYYAASDKGLSAKGTTILNYDLKKSATKTLRKPKFQLQEFLSRGLQKYWNAIRAVPQAISPRLHRETLILKAVDNDLPNC